MITNVMVDKKQEYLQAARNHGMAKRRRKLERKFRKAEWLGDLCGVTKKQFKKELCSVNIDSKFKTIAVLDGYAHTYQ